MNETRAIMGISLCYCLQETNLIEENKKLDILLTTLNALGYPDEAMTEYAEIFSTINVEDLLLEEGATKENLEACFNNFEVEYLKSIGK